MTVAVVLATYNGATYLPQQLGSIAQQTVRPDLVLVRDDGSSDGTVDLARSLLRSAELPHDVRSNAARLGAAGNFAAALSEVRADVVLLCDQDDVWHPTKVERLTRCLAEQSADAAVSNARLVDSTGQPLGEDLWTRVGFGEEARRSWLAGGQLDLLLRRSIAPGATMALTAGLLDTALPVPCAGWHDRWLLLVAATLGPVALVPEVLMDYRLHEGNTVGLPSAAGHSVRQRTRTGVVSGERDRLAGELQQLTELLQRIPDSRRSGLVEDAARHAAHRRSLPATGLRRARAVLRESRLGGYARYGNGWRSAAVDLLAPGA